MAAWNGPIVAEDGKVYAKATLRQVLGRCDLSDTPILAEFKRLYDDNDRLRELVRELWTYAEQELLCDENCPHGAVCDWKDCVFERRMRELGVDE